MIHLQAELVDGFLLAQLSELTVEELLEERRAVGLR